MAEEEAGGGVMAGAGAVLAVAVAIVECATLAWGESKLTVEQREQQLKQMEQQLKQIDKCSPLKVQGAARPGVAWLKCVGDAIGQPFTQDEFDRLTKDRGEITGQQMDKCNYDDIVGSGKAAAICMEDILGRPPTSDEWDRFFKRSEKALKGARP